MDFVFYSFQRSCQIPKNRTPDRPLEPHDGTINLVELSAVVNYQWYRFVWKWGIHRFSSNDSNGLDHHVPNQIAMWGWVIPVIPQFQTHPIWPTDTHFGHITWGCPGSTPRHEEIKHPPYRHENWVGDLHIGTIEWGCLTRTGQKADEIGLSSARIPSWFPCPALWRTLIAQYDMMLGCALILLGSCSLR